MSANDEFLTLESRTHAEIKVKGSRFIGTASPTQSIEEAEQFITKLNKQYFNATHNCYAFRIKSANQITYSCSDAGEPSGTAGLPILNVITRRELLNLIVVVTRFFGGIKLGKGGLIRAYGDCTKKVLDMAVVVKKINLVSLTFSFPYKLTGNIMHIIPQFNGNIISSTYDQQVELTIKIPQRVVDNFKNRIVEITSGIVKFTQRNGVA